MVFKLKPEKERFLKLAIKSITGSPSAAERAELKKLMRQEPTFGEDYSELERQLRDERDEDFLELCLKVLFKTASSKEVQEIRSLKEANPGRWEEFQQLAFILEVVGQSSKAPIGSAEKPEPMPERVRERLFDGLKKKRQKLSETK